MKPESETNESYHLLFPELIEDIEYLLHTWGRDLVHFLELRGQMHRAL